MEWWQLLVFACCIGIMFVGLALLMPPITGESAAEAEEEVEVAKGEESVGRSGNAARRDSMVVVTTSVSFANHPSYRKSVAARASERRASQVAAGIQDIYGGAGAGVGIRRSSLTAPVSAIRRSSLGAPRRSSLGSSLGTEGADPTEVRISMDAPPPPDQMPTLGEVSSSVERETFSSPSEYSRKRASQDFRRIAGGRESTKSPGAPLPPVTPPMPEE